MFKLAQQFLTPPLFAWVRSTMRLSVGGVFYALGYSHIAAIFTVMAGISLIATIEIQVAREIAKNINFSALKRTKHRPRRLGDGYDLQTGFYLFAATDPGTMRQKRARFRTMLIDGDLVAFGVPAGDEQPQEIAARDFVNLSIRLGEGTLVDSQAEIAFTEIRVHPDLARIKPPENSDNQLN